MTLQSLGEEKVRCSILTVLDEGLRAGKPPVSGSHVEGGLVVLTLSRWSQRGWRKICKETVLALLRTRHLHFLVHCSVLSCQIRFTFHESSHL